MSYSPDGDWLAGGAADQAAHKIYIWDLSNDGQFASALDGGREPLIDMHVGDAVVLCVSFQIEMRLKVASYDIFTLVGYEARQHSCLALSPSRKVGRLCRGIRRSR